LLLGFQPISSNLVLYTLFLKSPTLIKNELSNYDRSLILLSFLSKLTERVVKSRLTGFLTEYNLLNSFQSACTKLHSIETALLAVHDYLIRFNSQQNISCLCLLDLSAAFDTIDQSVLLERLSSWFGISGTALNWVKSYLSLGLSMSRLGILSLLLISFSMVSPMVLFLVLFCLF
jgi:Reverse transcriptase (RNA-dependent DNA polymerase)